MVGIEGRILLQNGCKVVLESETLVSPAWSVLPMGWSLYFAHGVTEAIASRAPALNGLSPLHDKTQDLVLGRHEGALAYYVYVHNLGVIAKTQQEADIVLEQWKNLFTENGLSLHKSELSQKVKSLGVELDGLSVCCRVSGKRFWTLRRAVDEILRRRKITGRALEIVIGHITFVLLGARPALCTLHTCYRSMRAHLSRCDSPLDRNSGRTGCAILEHEGLLHGEQPLWLGDDTCGLAEGSGRAHGKSERTSTFFICGGPGARESAGRQSLGLGR